MAEFSTGSSRQQAICGVFVYPRHRFYTGHVSHLSNGVVEHGSVSSGQSLIILLDKYYHSFFTARPVSSVVEVVSPWLKSVVSDDWFYCDGCRCYYLVSD